jgi:hypothetical protein
MRITRSTLDNLCSVLNRRLNRPASSWTKNADKTLTANVGHIHVTGWAPGDGWRRYQVCEMLERGGVTTISPMGNASDIFYYLRGVLDSLDERYKEFPPARRTLATLTPEQDKVWTKLFEIEANNGCSDSEADRRAWAGLCEQWPELAQYEGCRP